MLLALLRSTHPGPALVVTAVAVLLGAAVGLEPWRLIVLGIAMALDQASVGLANDWLDAGRDRAVGRRGKPVARGEVGVGTARAVAITAAVAALVVTVPLGWAATLAHGIALASAWSYNLGLKRTAASIVPYLVSFGLLPAIATLARPEPALPAWWAVGAGALLGAAAHVANAMPDLDDDRRTGVLGLPHRLPRPVATALVRAAVVVAALLIAVGTGWTLASVVGLAITAAITAVGLLTERRGPTRWAFRLVMAAALVDVVMLVAAGSHLVAA